MKRRQFVKTTTTASIALSIMPMAGYSSISEKKELLLNQSLILRDFNSVQEESPTLVTDGNGNIWMFSLRRIDFPENTELISSFHFDGKKWTETDPVTKSTSQYETPTSACAIGGKPIVAWTEIKGKDWGINVSQMDGSSYRKPHRFIVEGGKSINPVLTAPDKNRNWIAWENLHNGKFTIYISKYEHGKWLEPIKIDKGKNSCFDPGIAEAKNGDLYIIYGLTNGFHQDIEMTIIDGKTLEVQETIPVAIGGKHKNRVNINARPVLEFDAHDNLWISYESNRDKTRVDDGDNYTGDRCCAILSYQNGKIVEINNKGKWLFKGQNDHKPSFIKDIQGNLYLATHCGGNFIDSGWKYRLAWLDPQNGWQEPVTLFNTKIKGVLIPPAIAFDEKGNFWLATNNEKVSLNDDKANADNFTQSRLTELNVMQFTAPRLSEKYEPVTFKETQIRGFLPNEQTISSLSGHPKMERRKITIDGETYTLIYGNLHEHSNSSFCWPAGTDGTLHEDYRFGIFSEGYDFVGMTDHAGSTSEIHWRRNIRIADFYT